MKKKLFIISVSLLFLLISCKTTKNTANTDPNFIGDFDPIKLESVIVVQYSKLSGIKPQNLDLYFIPRTNNVEVHFRQGINQIALVLTPKNRQLIEHSIESYMTAYQNGTLSTENPSRKNSFARSKGSLSWGLLGIARNTDAEFFTSHQFLDPRRPYFNIHYIPSPEKADDSIFSPAVDLYFSPAQLAKIAEVLNQETLISKVEELQKQADSFDVESTTEKDAEDMSGKSFDKYEKF